MLNKTLAYLKCPKKKRGNKRCQGTLGLSPGVTPKKMPTPGTSDALFEVRSGSLECQQCHAKFPILEGIPLLVDDVRLYLLTHVKGIAQVVADSEIPREYLSDYLEAKEEVQQEHIEEDLEAERVNALYLMNHYLRVKPSSGGEQSWWKPRSGEASPLIDSLVRDYWDKGPFAQIENWIARLGKTSSSTDVVELGCGVGGLYRQLKPHVGSYLGVDSSFASIALCRHLALGVPYKGTLRIPEDLLQGSVSREVKISVTDWKDGNADFIVGDLENLPLQSGKWNIALTLNTIDMLDNPAALPEIQYSLLKTDGIAIQSCPYIWHDVVSKKLRKLLPREIVDSARAVEWLYEKAGFKIQERVAHLPWLFFKHVRQLEIYSVHLFIAKKLNRSN